MLSDLQFAFRLLRKAPGFTVAAVLTLALGVGANSAVYSLTDALGLRPPPVREVDRLVAVFDRTPQDRQRSWSYPDYADLRTAAKVYADVAAYGVRGVALTGGAEPEVTTIEIVTWNYLSLLGVSASRGRVFVADEDRLSQAPPVAMISDALWKRRFGGRFDSGLTVELNGQTWTVVGVLPAGFTGLEPQIAPDVWVTTAGWARLTSPRDVTERDNNWYDLVARLRPGATVEQAQQETDAFGRHLAEAFPQFGRERGAVILPVMESRGRGAARLRVLLLAIVGLVLLIACANVAALLTGRAQARQRELGIRAALGAGRSRLFRQLLIEHVVLAALSSAAALVMAAWIVRMLPSLLPPTPIPLGYRFTVDARVVGFTLMVSLLTLAVFGLVPALIASRPDVLPLLRSGARTSGAGRARTVARHLLVSGQFAASLILVASAGLMAQSLWRLSRVDAGFARRPLLITTVAPGVAGYTGDRIGDLARSLVARLSAVPGIEQAAAARRMPLSPFGGGATDRVVIPGQEPPAGQDAWTIKTTAVGPGYFATVGTRLLRGRDFGDADRAGAPGVVVISRAMADRFWPGAEPIGRQILLGAQSVPHEIVGVVEDVKINSLRETSSPYLYRAYYQRPSGDLTLIARTSTDGGAVATAVREAIRQAEPRLPMLRMITLREHLWAATFDIRIQATLVGIMGGVGLLLAVVGLFGVVAYLVNRRAQEFGVRLALGARPAAILWGVLRQGLQMAVIGAAIGVAGALLAGRALAGLFYEVRPTDPLTLTASVVALAIAALLASYLPARRASRTDPVTILRSE